MLTASAPVFQVGALKSSAAPVISRVQPITVTPQVAPAPGLGYSFPGLAMGATMVEPTISSFPQTPHTVLADLHGDRYRNLLANAQMMTMTAMTAMITFMCCVVDV